MTISLSGRRVFVAGHGGMVGSALLRRLAPEGAVVVTAPRSALDLRVQGQVSAFMMREKPEIVVVAAATVGGIHANDTRPADFLYDNLMIAANLIEAAHQAGVQKLLYLASSCVYPRLAPQPIDEDDLLTGRLEPTNEWYAVAKISGLKLCQAYRKQHGRNFIACQPTNLYGPNDGFDLSSSHVLPALLRKAHEAKVAGAPTMTVWGTGKPLREFLHVDDLADALVFLLRHYDGETALNIGSGEEISIADVARLIADTVGFKGDLVFDASKPDGTPRKLLDASRLRKLGWQPKIALRPGLRSYYDWFLENGSAM